MTNAEFDDFVDTVRHYVEELDQHEAWKFETKYGTVYVRFSRDPSPGTDDSYIPM